MCHCVVSLARPADQITYHCFLTYHLSLSNHLPSFSHTPAMQLLPTCNTAVAHAFNSFMSIFNVIFSPPLVLPFQSFILYNTSRVYACTLPGMYSVASSSTAVCFVTKQTPLSSPTHPFTPLKQHRRRCSVRQLSNCLCVYTSHTC